MSSNKAKQLLYDKQIIGRVEECLLESTEKTLADFGTVVRMLQHKFPEYRRRRQGPFRQLVKQAYRIVCEDLCENMSETSGTDSETDIDSDQEHVPAAPQPNILNNLFQNMYKAKNHTSTPTANVISIKPSTIVISSSDEDDSTEPKSPYFLQNDDNSNISSKCSTLNEANPDENTLEATEALANREKPALKRKNDVRSSQPLQKRMFKKQIIANKPCLNFENVGGIDHILKRLCEELFNVVAPEYYQVLGAKPPNGILITGQTGCGKNTLAEAIAGQIEFKFINVPAIELIAGVTGESEERIRDVFEQAILFAPCVLFIDDIDAIGGNRANAQKEMQSRMTSQLINCLDTLKAKSWDARILVIGATSRPDALDPALRRPGRFDYEIALPVPDRRGRFEIFEKFCHDLPMDKCVIFDQLAELTPGYVAADIGGLLAKAGTIAVKRLWSAKLYELDSTENISTKTLDEESVKENGNAVSQIPSPPTDWQPTLAQLLNWLANPPLNKFDSFVFTMNDFLEALKVYQPSAKREGFITVPDISWSDIGSLHDIRDQLRLAVLAPVKYPKAVERLGLSTPAGVLLCGPPGCGKTLIAKAIANEAGTNFISVKGPEMMNMYVGESERAVRECFQRARNSAPCVIFFDEFDSLCPKRSNSAEAGSHGTRIVNQLLTEMDGVQERKGVYVMAASNRPDIIDPAILRPGRLDNIVYIGMPDESARCEILNAITKNGTRPVMAEDVKFEEIAKMTDGYTGADLSGLTKQASQLALKHALQHNVPDEELRVRKEHIVEAIKLTRPSVSEQDRKVYEELRSKYGSKEAK